MHTRISVATVVSRGGRPDLAQCRLGTVRAPTLLIVGGCDPMVLEFNTRARDQLRWPTANNLGKRSTVVE